MKYNALITTSQRVQERVNGAYLIHFLAFNRPGEKSNLSLHCKVSYNVMLATKLSNLTSTKKRKRKEKNPQTII